jgi:lipopolysaccharide exporter
VNEPVQGPPSTSSKAISGFRWVTVGMGFQKVFQILAVVVLARLLTPADFGLVTVATLTLGAVTRIKQLGLYSALVQRRTDVQEAANACLAMTGILSVVFYGAIVAASPLIAGYFTNSQVRSVLNVLALSLIIDAASGVQKAWVVRNMQFRKHSIIDSVETSVTAVTSMTLASIGFGVWALVWGSLAGPLAGAVLWWTVNPWRPTRSFNSRVAGEMLGFGVKLSVAGTLDGLTDTAIRTVVGRQFGVTPLGYFDFAMRLIQIPFRHVIELTQRVALPAYSRESDNLARIGRWHLMVTRYSCLLMGCLAVPMGVLADPFIPLIFGEQWRPALPLIRILAPTMFLMPLLYAWAAHTATTNLNVLVVFMAIRLVITSAAFAWAAGFGLGSASAALLIATTLLSGLHLVHVKHCLGLTASEILSAFAVPLVSCVLAAMTMLGVRGLADYLTPGHDVVAGVFAMVAGFAMLTGIVLLLHPETLGELRQLVRSLPESRTQTMITEV